MSTSASGWRDLTCDNRRRIKRQELEGRALTALTTKFFEPAAFTVFCEEFVAETNRLRMEARAGLSGTKRDLERTRREIEKIIDAIVGGYAGPELKDRMAVLQAKKEELIAQLAATEEPAPLLHPNMANVYRRHVDRLVKALTSGEEESGAAREALRAPRRQDSRPARGTTSSRRNRWRNARAGGRED
jgi:site-specific DNA recombinase